MSNRLPLLYPGGSYSESNPTHAQVKRKNFALSISPPPFFDFFTSFQKSKKGGGCARLTKVERSSASILNRCLSKVERLAASTGPEVLKKREVLTDMTYLPLRWIVATRAHLTSVLKNTGLPGFPGRPVLSLPCLSPLRDSGRAPDDFPRRPGRKLPGCNPVPLEAPYGASKPAGLAPCKTGSRPGQPSRARPACRTSLC